MPQWRASLHVHTTPLPPLSPLEPTSPPLPSPLVFLPCTRSQHARALLADVGRRARASRLRNHVSEENLAAGYFLKIRDFKIRVGKQPPSPLLHPIRESRATPLDHPLSYSRSYLDTALSLPPRGVLRPNLRPLVTVSSLLACTHAPDGANG